MPGSATRAPSSDECLRSVVSHRAGAATRGEAAGVGERLRAVGQNNSPDRSGFGWRPPRLDAPPHRRPATDVALRSGPVRGSCGWRTPRFACHRLPFLVGDPASSGPLGTVRTLYTNTARLSSPFVRDRRSASGSWPLASGSWLTTSNSRISSCQRAASPSLLLGSSACSTQRLASPPTSPTR